MQPEEEGFKGKHSRTDTNGSFSQYLVSEPGSPTNVAGGMPSSAAEGSSIASGSHSQGQPHQGQGQAQASYLLMSGGSERGMPGTSPLPSPHLDAGFSELSMNSSETDGPSTPAGAQSLGGTPASMLLHKNAADMYGPNGPQLVLFPSGASTPTGGGQSDGFFSVNPSQSEGNNAGQGSTKREGDWMGASDFSAGADVMMHAALPNGRGPAMGGRGNYANMAFIASQAQKQQQHAAQMNALHHQHEQQYTMGPPRPQRQDSSGSSSLIMSPGFTQTPTKFMDGSLSGGAANPFAGDSSGYNEGSSPHRDNTSPHQPMVHSNSSGGPPNPSALSDSTMAQSSSAPAQSGTAMETDEGHKDDRRNRFVHKLYKMVCDADCQHLISWATSGTSVVVYNVDDFSSQVLGKHFKHNNFSSFIRQLNM